jgi:hypothetical protein
MIGKAKDEQENHEQIKRSKGVPIGQIRKGA